MAASLSDALTAEQIGSVRKALPQASLLPPTVYSNEELFRLERERVFGRNWLPVCHMSQIPEPGSFVAKTLFGEPVLAVRDRNGEVRVFSNVCRHRNMILKSGEGKCAGARISCPYHGWTYGLDGRLLAAPYMDQTASFDKEEQRLPQIRFEIWHGFVFVNFTADAAALRDQVLGLERYVGPYGFENMVALEVKRLRANWNWKVSLENFSEAYHQPWVHPQTSDQFFPASGATYYDNDGEAWGAFFIPERNGQHMPTMVASIEGLPEHFYLGATVFNIYPYFHALTDPATPLWLDFDIRGMNDHELVWRIMVPTRAVTADNRHELIAKARAVFEPILTEDVEICRGVAAGTSARLARPGRLSYMEKTVHQFHNWWLDRMEAP